MEQPKQQVEINLYPRIDMENPVDNVHTSEVVDQTKIDRNESLPKDILYMGTIGRITAYDISQSFDFTNSIERSLPVKWTNQAYEVSRSGKYHNTAFCLHYDRPILFSAFNGTITAMSSDHGQVIWQVRPSKASGLMSDDLGTISLSPLFPEKLFYGCNGHGFCLDQNNGEILWETSLKKTGWNNVSILPFSPESIIMGSQGYCCALDPSDGKIMWENKLEGTGFGDLTFAKYKYSSHGSFSENLLFVGIDGYVLSLNPKTGETKHKLNLKNTGFNCVSLLVDSQYLFVVTCGKAYCIQPESLRILWKNGMSGMGLLYGQSIADIGDYVYVGTFGKVTCMNKKMGTTVWTTSLPSCGYDIVTLQVLGNRLIAGSNGKLYQVDVKKGEVMWKDNLKGYSCSYIYLGGYATYGATDHNSTTIVQYIASMRRKNKS